MALHLRAARWRRLHLAVPPRRRLAAATLAVGATAFVAGGAMLAGTFAPMWGIGTDTVTITAPILMNAPPARSDMLSSLTGTTSQTEAAIIDRPVNGVAFNMSIPAIGYSATVYEGVDLRTLEKGPGHYPTTAWPGHAGNVGIAAHNVYWLGFSRIKPGDTVELQTRRGLFVYRITDSGVVHQPDDQTVLMPTTDSKLTLTTCYPLWAGAYATKRLVFSAVEIGAVE
jgi:LPXTG-site transpeptidase (sortase) family protein